MVLLKNLLLMVMVEKKQQSRQSLRVSLPLHLKGFIAILGDYQCLEMKVLG